ncbi:hypothetical protein PR202_ga27451 [Eleusine coracana subsp. coracana]|uniref:F-box domain-containing protein n=1 Tax=Eleusine coracana subsp. coracana TaxID=191504 RepID=A0AAV5DFA2_ELECO|nr:hypothetical protein PR202_ga27451 [Eleusine coracana subsp. coracana]
MGSAMSHCRHRRRHHRRQPTLTDPEATAERNWSDMHVDVLLLIFAKLGTIEVITGAGLVCHSWLDAAMLPHLWQSVDMSNHKVVEEMDGNVLCAVAKVAVDRSCGRLETFVGKGFVTDDLLNHIGNRAPSLKGLRLISCSAIFNAGVAETIKKFPLLDDLEISLCSNVYGKNVFNTIAMTKLKSLQLFGSNLTKRGLIAILDSCPHLESLDIRNCYNIQMDNTLQGMCAGIKSLKLPHDSIDDYEYKDKLPICSCECHDVPQFGCLVTISHGGFS